ncbi:MAG: hypothetical protein GKS02_05110 [Alphaproteobacteria bacterium]|nr:hypothetical protein [Alphaproteobacteria bacterium]
MAPGIGDTLRRLLGSSGQSGEAQAAGAPVAYKGYIIQPAPKADGKQWLTAGVITKEFGETVKEHRFVRGDYHGSRDTAAEFSISKGQQIVDLEGDRIFD